MKNELRKKAAAQIMLLMTGAAMLCFGMCIRACPTNAVCFRYGFGNGKETTKKTTTEESK